MTSKELRRLSRQDLLELLIRQQQENEDLMAKVVRLEQQLQERMIHIENAGSLAEAVLVLNGVFADADRAVEQYTENIRRCSEEQEASYNRIILAAEQKAEEIIRAAEEEKNKKIEEADLYCRQKINELEKLLQAHPESKELLARTRSEK